MGSVQKVKAKSKPANGKAGSVGECGPTLSLSVNGDKKKVSLAKLADDKYVAGLQKECDQSKEPVKVWLAPLLGLQDNERWQALDFVFTLKKCRKIVGGQGYDDLFEAVLALPVNPEELQALRCWKMAALEAAVIGYPDALDVTCNRVRDRLRKLKVTGVRVADLVKDARSILTQLQAGAVAAGKSVQTKVVEALPGAPVTAEVVIPSGWRLTPAGVEKQGGDGVAVNAPVLIVERGKDARRGQELVTLAWHRDGAWHRRVVGRGEVADQRSILRLAELGLPVTCINARTLIQYLDEFEATNLPHLPSVRVSHKMGWQGEDGVDGFLWGRNLVTAEEVHLEGKDPQQSGSQLVRFRGIDEGDDQLADGFRQSGNFKGWVKAAKRLRHHPRALVALYASFVPPMLPVLGTFNHVIDFAGQTTSGKTTVLRVAASVWGNPDERSAGAVLSTWNCTATWRERVPVVCCHLPLILDDTKNVRFPEEVAKTVYAITQGRGRGRGTVKGIAEQASAETVLLSSGEQPATSFSKDGGTRPRVLSFWGSPFGETSPEMGERIRRINEGVRKHYGHAGPRFVQHMLRQKDDWAGWKEWYEGLVEYYEGEAGENYIAGRMASHFAAIVVTSHYVHEALELPWEWENPIAPVWDELVSSSAEADVAARALALAVDWAVAHRQNFFYHNQADSNQPHSGWVGRWDKDSSNPEGSKWAWLGIFSHVLEGVLKEGGHDFDATVRTWKDRGWLEVDAEGEGKGRNTKRVKVGAALARVVAIRREAIEAMIGGKGE